MVRSGYIQNRCIQRKVGIRDMFTIDKAAELLGRSAYTIRRWMKKFDIKVVSVVTDRKRVYIADDDMKVLTDHAVQDIINRRQKTRKHPRSNRAVITQGEEKYYSLSTVATLLGVSFSCIEKWVTQDDIVTKLIATDRRRRYIEHQDILRLADLHGRKLPSKFYEETNTPKEPDSTPPDIDKLYSITDAASCLNASPSSVRKWMSQDNIEKNTMFRGRYITCITYRDILRLAELHGCEAIPNPPSLTVVEEIKHIKEVLQKHDATIDGIIHDLRIIAKRSIFVRREE